MLARAVDGNGELPLERVVGLMQKLMSHLDLESVLVEIVDTAQLLFGAELATLWMYEADRAQLACVIPRTDPRLMAGLGVALVGTCAASQAVVNVSDVAADPRFIQALDGGAQIDRGSMLSVPIIDSNDVLVGVLQLLDEDGLPFDARAESMARLLAAQAAVALQAVRMHLERMEYQRLHQEIELARAIQIGTLPETMPVVPGYEVHGHFQPAERAGGDLFDLAVLGGRLFMLMGDATGHGFGPALSATQMQAMLRAAFRCGAGLDQACRHVNNQLCEDLPDNRFITAFMGFLDPVDHRVRFHSGGQGPILHWRASVNAPQWHAPTTFPFGAMQIDADPEAGELELARGDVLALISDGVYEYANPAGELFGNKRVAGVFEQYHALPLPELTTRLLQAVSEFAAGATQADDITLVLARRQS
ncbi:MAG TPA: GAF domain-containing SpoIIE family protein phosphatase [Rhodanobacteraceae bacterium]|jgi:phosphoserine phosphatase|nr:GAF domain-containing SpoIIE family protein phosphatase [Rhodanobacteraceae bacterium]